ncbi:uncharacterized protein LOC121238203 [Juglans microcarpa x Juglans regia]|uniref:uncharacterized protein LOC121238203 n=1 Tax=Juglans microcarpa x Juglans regia TaxID=2249226 RepID=UPI001B7EBD3A|nr:uncharacterized protein LOC121238203 [Juglans microcarpa x Juglans regia]
MIPRRECGYYDGIYVIWLDKIMLQETALVKGWDHAYCLNDNINDYMFEECVCLLLRVNLFKPLIVENQEDIYDDAEDYYPYKEEEDDLDEVCFSSSTNLFIGNRSWGDNGYVRLRRQEASALKHEAAVKMLKKAAATFGEVGPDVKPFL